MGFFSSQIEFKKINVRERDKLNFLGDMIEYNDLNVNKAYYGPLRTTVLMMLGFIHDPDGANGVSLVRSSLNSLVRWHLLLK